uniref:Uncharacterized protein n=1 Tax=Sphaerodactylus townsendi TaxID=933632 RepID=A0ACB8FTS2_9SAUR
MGRRWAQFSRLGAMLDLVTGLPFPSNHRGLQTSNRCGFPCLFISHRPPQFLKRTESVAQRGHVSFLLLLFLYFISSWELKGYFISSWELKGYFISSWELIRVFYFFLGTHKGILFLPGNSQRGCQPLEAGKLAA